MRQKKKKNIEKRLNIPPVGIIDNIVFSKNEAWAYYILSEKPFEFLSSSARVNLANNTMNSLSSLCQTADKKVDCHLLITNQAFNPDSWREQMYQLHNELIEENTISFDNFIEDQTSSLHERNYKKRVTYLGVKLFTRGSLDFSSINPLEFGIKEAAQAFKKSVSSIFLFDSTEITFMEEKRMREYETEIFRRLSQSSFQAKKPSSEEILLTIKQRFYPAMPTPYLETNHQERIGLSDIVIESGGTVEVKPRWLKMTQFIDGEIYEGYRATISFSKLPKEMYSPSPVPPFLYKSSMLNCTVNCRFTLVPTEDMKKDLNKKKMESEDELNNLIESKQKGNASLKETIQDIDQLEQNLEDESLPWISGSYRITVEHFSEENIKTIITALKQEYAKHDYVLSWSTGDQLHLFREEFFGGKLEISAFTQTTNLALLGIAGINYGGLCGDPVKQQKVYNRR